MSTTMKPWRDELHRLAALELPLLPCGAGAEQKGPIDPATGHGLRQWPTARYTVPELLAMNGVVLSVGTRTGDGILCFDFDGGTAIELALTFGCDPQKAQAWQVHRDTDPLRLKVLYVLSEEQQEELGMAVIAKYATAPAADGRKGEALELFHSPSKQVLLLGHHVSSGGHYFWPVGMGPEALGPIPLDWWELAKFIVRSEPEPSRAFSNSSSSNTSRSRSSGEWQSIGTRAQPCPICGRNSTGYCSQHRTRGTIRCHHGNTFNPEARHGPLRKGQTITGSDGITYGFSKAEQQHNGDTFSTFVRHQPREHQRPPQAAAAGGAPPEEAQEQEHLEPASWAGLIQILPDGWQVDEETGARKRSGLSAGHLADLLEEHQHLLRYNELTMFVEVHTRRGWCAVVDAEMDSAYVLLSQKGWAIALDPITKAVCHVARLRSFHPVRQYLLDLEQNQQVQAFNLDDVAPRFFRSLDPLHVAMVRKWLIGAVARAMDPGCHMDYALVLQSRQQGIGKSTSLRDLASCDWFTSTVPDADKDFLLNVHSCWIFELAELESHTSKRDAGRLKNLISTQTDMFRVPYGRTAERRPRGSVFCGTVNEHTFLRDETGNRRYWVVPIKGSDPLDREGLKAARDGIWRAAMAAWRAGELPMLTRAQEALSEIQNSEFIQSDPWMAMLQASMEQHPLHWQEPFSTAKALVAAGLKKGDQIVRADANRVALLLRQLGFEKAKNPATTDDGKRVRLWSRAQPAHTCTTSIGAGCAPPDPLRRNGSQRSAQPAQPNSSERWGSAGDVGGGGGGQSSPSLVVQQVVQVVHPSRNDPNQLQRLGRHPAQPQAKRLCSGPEVVHPQQPALPPFTPAPVGSGSDVADDGDDPHWGPRRSAA